MVFAQVSNSLRWSICSSGSVLLVCSQVHSRLLKIRHPLMRTFDSFQNDHTQWPSWSRCWILFATISYSSARYLASQIAHLSNGWRFTGDLKGLRFIHTDLRSFREVHNSTVLPWSRRDAAYAGYLPAAMDVMDSSKPLLTYQSSNSSRITLYAEDPLHTVYNMQFNDSPFISTKHSTRRARAWWMMLGNKNGSKAWWVLRIGAAIKRCL